MQKKIAIIRSDTEPNREQAEKIKNYLVKKHGELHLLFKKDDSISNGFIIEIGSEIYDWSKEGRLKQLSDYIESLNITDKFVPILHRAVDKWKPVPIKEEFGKVISVGDGIARVSGLLNAVYGEILFFENGAHGLVLDLKKDSIGCVLFDKSSGVTEGSFVQRSGKAAGFPVGEKFLGRVINPLGEAIDGLEEIEAEQYYPIEKHAPGIIDRQPVNSPLETGILCIDAMFPIGKGQRELIIGDRQTGKTTIAVDTILNQKDKNVICIYVAIGQRAANVASIVDTLKKHNAMDYTIVINSSSSDSSSAQYIAPYAGCAIGEYFMDQGKDVLIVYDDLSKHAIAYRTLSLLLGRAAGREAYPGDIFYLHSRLLERSAHLSNDRGGGSLTALPVVETQAGDVSAYIPTNVISITDGQLFLETNLFFSGQRPAINVGLSVSRVGGDAQSKAIKSSCGTLRLDLAQYREMEVFTQFAGDLDKSTEDRLKYGKCLMNTLKQGPHSPVSRHRQVIMLIASLSRVTINIPLNETGSYFKRVFDIIENEYPQICKEIDTSGQLSKESKDIISEVCKNI